jgi:hypothetical protein
MKDSISKIIIVIGALSAVGMIYLLATQETNNLFYSLMLITLLTWPASQYISEKRILHQKQQIRK